MFFSTDRLRGLRWCVPALGLLLCAAASHAAAFEVTAIHPSKPGDELSFDVTATGYSARSTPLYWLIMEACFPRPAAYWRSDRLKKVHVEGSMFALVVASRTPKLHASLPGEHAGEKGIRIGDSGAMTPLHVPGYGHVFRFTQTSMAALAEVLSGLGTLTDTHIEDRTGLTGKYDFVLVKREDQADPTPARASRWARRSSSTT